MSHVRCNLCEADDYAVLFPADPAGNQPQQIVRCNRCGLMYANPQTIVDCVSFKAEDHPQSYDPTQGRQYFQKQHVQLPDNERALRIINELLPQRGKLLEIGSFLGIFLDRIRADGWDVTGLEPDQGPADYARSTYGLRIVTGLLPHADLPKQSFDAVVLLHVIEHMPDPSGSVRDIHALMKPGGIFAVETPRFDSLMFKILGRRERSINNCHGHIYFFTVPTLRQLLEKNGFEVIRTELVGRTLTLDRLLYNVGLMSRNACVRQWTVRLGSALSLDRVRVHVNVRDMQRVYCRAR